MRILNFLILVFVSYGCLGQHHILPAVATASRSNPIGSFDELMTYSPATRSPDAIVVNSSPYTNLAPAGWMIDPNDPTKFLYYVNELQGNTRFHGRIRLYRGEVNDPINGTYTDEGIVLEEHVTSGQPDDDGIGFGSVLTVGDTIYMFYIGIASSSGTNTQTVCKAYSFDGETWIRKGQVLAPDMVTFFNFTDPTVIYEGGVMYMYVTGKSNGAGTGLPNLGIECYSSTNYGRSWTHEGKSVAMGGTRDYNGLYIESAGYIKLGSDHVLMTTTTGDGNVWSIAIAHSTDPTAAFTAEPIPWFQHGLTGPDSRSVAVVLAMELNGRLFITYQGTTQFQPADTWDICIAEFTLPVEEFPVGLLRGRGSWTGDGDFFETQGDVTLGTETRSIRALSNTPHTAVYNDHTIDVHPASNSSVQVKMRSTVVVTNAFIGGWYIREGSNTITGIYFRNGNLQYLPSGGTWTTIQAAAINTTYDVQVVLETNSTFDVYVDGVLKVNNATPFTNISVKADKIRIEKSAASTTLLYFGELSYINSGSTTIIDYGQ